MLRKKLHPVAHFSVVIYSRLWPLSYCSSQLWTVLLVLPTSKISINNYNTSDPLIDEQLIVFSCEASVEKKIICQSAIYRSTLVATATSSNGVLIILHLHHVQEEAASDA
jgi:hypothetical protein